MATLPGGGYATYSYNYRLLGQLINVTAKQNESFFFKVLHSDMDRINCVQKWSPGAPVQSKSPSHQKHLPEHTTGSASEGRALR